MMRRLFVRELVRYVHPSGRALLVDRRGNLKVRTRRGKWHVVKQGMTVEYAAWLAGLWGGYKRVTVGRFFRGSAK